MFVGDGIVEINAADAIRLFSTEKINRAFVRGFNAKLAFKDRATGNSGRKLFNVDPRCTLCLAEGRRDIGALRLCPFACEDFSE